jgi:hypothetical protein
MDEQLLAKIRADSLSQHEGATRKYGSLPINSCLQVIVNYDAKGGPVKVVFEEIDGWGHGLNVPQNWIVENHVGKPKDRCPRCKGAGKLVIGGIDCTECKGTGMINTDKRVII